MQSLLYVCPLTLKNDEGPWIVAFNHVVVDVHIAASTNSQNGCNQFSACLTNCGPNYAFIHTYIHTYIYIYICEGIKTSGKVSTFWMDDI